MAGSLVIRTGLTIVGSLPSGTGDPQLTLDAASKQVGQIPSVDPSSYLSTTLPNTQILIGNGSNLAAAVAITGAISITNTGVVTLNTGIVFNSNINALAGIDYSKLNLTGGIVNNDINASAAITRTKIANSTAYRVLVNNATGVFTDNAAITASRALISDANGLPTHSAVTAATLAFLDATSSVQTQINTKLTFTASPVNGDVIYYNGGTWNRLAIGSAGQVLLVSAGLPAWGAPTANGVPIGGTAGQYLNKIDATNYNTQWSTLILSAITDVTATAAQVNVLATGFYDATSSVQTQLTLKLDKTLPLNSIFVGNVSNVAVPLATGANGYLLTSVAGVPTWVAPGSGGTVTSVAASGGTTGLSFTGTPITVSGTLVLTGTLIAANGGTGQSSYTIGDILYASSSSVLSKLAAGTATYVLTSNGAGVAPSWQASTTVSPAALTKTDDTNVTLTLGGTPATALLQATSITVGWNGTLAVARGGTGSATFPGWLLASGGALTADNTISGGFAVDFNTISRLSVTQSVQTASWSKAFNVTPGNHTGLTAGTEFTGLATNVAAFTHQWATGALAQQRWNYIGVPTITFVGVSTVTNAYNVYIEAPAQGANATITNNYALGVAGTSYVFNTIASATTQILDANNTIGGVWLRFTTGLRAAEYGRWQVGGNSVDYVGGQFKLGFSGVSTTFTQSNNPTSWIPAMTFQIGTHTGMTAATEFPMIVNNTVTMQWAAGTTATQRQVWFKSATLAGASATATFTNAYTLYVDPPVVGTNAAITNNYALGVTGSSNFTGANNNFSGTIFTNAITRLAVGTFTFTGQASSVPSWNFTLAGSISGSSGNNVFMQMDGNSNAATGTLAYDMLLIKQTVNATANGLYRVIALTPTYTAWAGSVTGIDYNPTVTSITGTHLAARFTAGDVLIGGTTITASTILDLQSTTKALRVSNVTNIASVTTPANGMITYDAATNLFNFRQAGAWVTGIGGGGGSSVGINTEVQLSNGAGAFLAGGMTWASNVFTLGISTNTSTTQSITTNGSTTTPPSLTIQPKASATTGITGATLTLAAGVATVGNANGGTLALTSGAPFGTGIPGDVTITAASAVGSTIAGGNISITPGAGTSGNANGGTVTINGGVPFGTGLPGAITLQGSTPVGSGVTGGTVQLTGGIGSSTGNSQGGLVNLVGGLGNNAGNGGTVSMQGGSAFGTGTGGLAQVIGGSAGGTMIGAGMAKLVGGPSNVTGITAGDAQVIGGTASIGNANGGNVLINVGVGVGSGVVGVIKVQGFTSFSVASVVPNVLVDINGGFALRQTSPASINADQNDYAIGAGTSFRITPTTSARTITGLTGGFDGKILVIRNVGSVNLLFAHENASSTAANRITTSTAASITLAPNGVVTLQYDSTASRWFDVAVR